MGEKINIFNVTWEIQSVTWGDNDKKHYSWAFLLNRMALCNAHGEAARALRKHPGVPCCVPLPHYFCLLSQIIFMSKVSVITDTKICSLFCAFLSYEKKQFVGFGTINHGNSGKGTAQRGEDKHS